MRRKTATTSKSAETGEHPIVTKMKAVDQGYTQDCILLGDYDTKIDTLNRLKQDVKKSIIKRQSEKDALVKEYQEYQTKQQGATNEQTSAQNS